MLKRFSGGFNTNHSLSLDHLYLENQKDLKAYTWLRSSSPIGWSFEQIY